MPDDRNHAKSREIPAADPLDLATGLFGFENRNEAAGDGAQEVPEKTGPDAHTIAFNSFLDGNDEAFRALYDAFERPLYLYVLRLMGSKGDAEDVFQDIWIRMFRLRGELKDVRKFSGLLFTVARNLSINAIRDRKREPGLSLEDAPFEIELVARNHEVEESDLRQMIERALMRLPIEQREAFVLREYFGYSYEEIAGITKSTMVTAKTRAWRARERLRKMIGAWLELKQ